MNRPTAWLTLPLACILFMLPARGSPRSTIAVEATEELIERLAERSGLEAADEMTRKVASGTLGRLVATYGDDVLRVVDDAGLELLEAVPRYGDDVVKMAMKATPAARSAFVCNIPELLPLVRRVGPQVLELEAKSPGLAVRVLRTFGDDVAKGLAKSVPAEDIPRLLRYAEKADSPATREALVRAYRQEGKGLFERIPPRLVLASGLSASMVYGTYALTEPVRAVGRTIENNTEVADTAVRRFAAWGACLSLAVAFVLMWRFRLMPWHGSPRRDAERSDGDASTGERAGASTYHGIEVSDNCD